LLQQLAKFIVMKKVIRFTVKFIIIAFVSLIILLLVFDRVTQFRMDDKEYTEWFAQKGLHTSIAYYQQNGRTIRYATIGSDTTATIFFIHGAPSSLSYYRSYMCDSTLLTKATMLAVDRPGYGYSGLGDPVTSIEEQVKMISPVLDSLHKLHHPVVVVAASYGTSIACRLAMDHPELVDGIVLIAPALQPGEEKYFWFTNIIESPIFHWFIPRMLKSANAEKVHHRQELEKMLPLWGNIKAPVIYLQGADDGLVFTTNAAFAKTHLTNVPYLSIEMIPNEGHLLVFSEKQKIDSSIIKMIDLAKLNIAGKLKRGDSLNITTPISSLPAKK
jgi:pimeloyl-ACP methyl ester carboxylesterase